MSKERPCFCEARGTQIKWIRHQRDAARAEVEALKAAARVVLDSHPFGDLSGALNVLRAALEEDHPFGEETGK